MSVFQNIRSKTPIIALASGVLCAVCVFLYIQDVTGEAQAARADALARYGGEQLEVCVAAHDLSIGSTIGEADIQTKLWIVDLLPADAVRTSSDILGKQVTSPILEGEVISLKRFVDQAFSIEVPEGMSAVCVPAKAVQAVGGALTPGMKVDVYATGDTTTTRIGQEMLILATSTSTSGSSGDSSVSWITLAVPPQSVQEFVVAAQESKLYFVLPNKTDTSQQSTSSNLKSESSIGTQQGTSNSSQSNKQSESQKDAASESQSFSGSLRGSIESLITE